LGSLRSAKSQGVAEEKAEKRRLALGSELGCACAWPSVQRKVHQLIRRGAPIDFVDPFNGMTPLGIAVVCSSASARVLLDYGANPNLRCADGKTPLLLAVDKGNVEMVKLLLSRGADPSLAGADGRKPLHLAVLKAHYEIVVILVAFGARP
jgi:ankyrin repeat protein